MPTCGLQSSAREMVQLLNDSICSSTRRPQVRSYLLLLLHKMFNPLCMCFAQDASQSAREHKSWVCIVHVIDEMVLDKVVTR